MQVSTPFSVILITTLQKATEVANDIESRKPTVLGFDLESSDTKKTDLISLCESDGEKATVFLFHIALIGSVPKSLKSILEVDRIFKSGNGMNNDIARLQNCGINFSGGIELSYLARVKGLPSNLKTLFNVLFNSYNMKELPSNTHGEWDKPLTPRLIEYASYDAYASLMCCLEMLGIKPEVNDVITEDNDCPDYREWIRQWITGRRSMESLINQTVSSYGPWVRKYKQEVRVELAKHNLMIGVSEEKYGYDKDAEVFYSLLSATSIILNEIVAKDFTASDYKLIDTLKYDSASNFLFNSSKSFNMIPSAARKEAIKLSIEKAIKDGKIVSKNGHLYVSK